VSPRAKAKEARLRRRLEVRYSDGNGPPLMGYSGNLSVHGIMIRTPRVFPPGTRLAIEVRFPDQSIRVDGRVVWAREGPMSWLATGRIGMGIKFDETPPELVERLAGDTASARAR
jgi:Tfp pilus assembly protein PilZ